VFAATRYAAQNTGHARAVVLVDALDAPGVRFLATWSGPDLPSIGTTVELDVPPDANEPLPVIRSVDPS
jgi:hypothetical protein